MNCIFVRRTEFEIDRLPKVSTASTAAARRPSMSHRYSTEPAGSDGSSARIATALNDLVGLITRGTPVASVKTEAGFVVAYEALRLFLCRFFLAVIAVIASVVIAVVVITGCVRVPAVQDHSRYRDAVFGETALCQGCCVTGGLCGADYENQGIGAAGQNSSIRDVDHRWRVDYDRIELSAEDLDQLRQPFRVNERCRDVPEVAAREDVHSRD